MRSVDLGAHTFVLKIANATHASVAVQTQRSIDLRTYNSSDFEVLYVQEHLAQLLRLFGPEATHKNILVTRSTSAKCVSISTEPIHILNSQLASRKDRAHSHRNEDSRSRREMCTARATKQTLKTKYEVHAPKFLALCTTHSPISDRYDTAKPAPDQNLTFISCH